MKKEKKLLFSLTKNDFEFQTFCTGGPGGQHKNAKQNGVRCIHAPSGVRAEHRDGRDQFINKRKAFEKVANDPKFQRWLKAEASRRMGILSEEERLQRELDAKVDRLMAEQNLKIEYL